jgi:RNA polymerase sigma-32 factor
MKTYMADIGNINRVSDNEALELFKVYAKTPSLSLRNKLVEQNLRLVFKVASKYGRNGIAYEDLIAEGNIGLIKGVEKFDHTRGTKPSTYLYGWIKAYVLRYILNNAHVVKIGQTESQRKLFFNLPKLRSEARNKGVELSAKDVAKQIGTTEEEVKEMDMRMSAAVLQIDPLPDLAKGAEFVVDALIDARIDDGVAPDRPDEIIEQTSKSQYVRDVVDKFLVKLSDREQDIFVSRRLKFDGGQDTYKDIALRHGSNKQRMKQIDDDVFGKFKKFLSHNQISFQ